MVRTTGQKTSKERPTSIIDLDYQQNHQRRADGCPENELKRRTYWNSKWAIDACMKAENWLSNAPMLQPINHLNVDIGKLDLRCHLWSSKLTTDPAKRGETRNATCAHVCLPSRFSTCRVRTRFLSGISVGYFFFRYCLIFFFKLLILLITTIIVFFLFYWNTT